MLSLGERLRSVGRLPFPLTRPTWPDSVERPAPERKIGLDYDHGWSRRYPVRLLRAMVLDDITVPAAALLAPTTVRGREYLDMVEGPVIFAANHASHLDTPLLLTTLPVRFRHRTVVAAASDYFFDRTWKAAMWAFAVAAIPVERQRVNRRSADTAAELLEEGWNLVIFPEGGRSPDGWMQPFRGGAAYLARRTGRPVVPLYLQGTRRVLGRMADDHGRPPGGSGSESSRAGRLRRGPVTVLFGKPVVPQPDEDARRLGERIERAVTVLGAELRTDWWTARRQAAESTDGVDGATALVRGPVGAPWRRSWALGRPEEHARGRRPLTLRRVVEAARGAPGAARRQRRWPTSVRH
jgi:1-acyl-sn-glycerol-3-phosphate acyltransferase